MFVSAMLKYSYGCPDDNVKQWPWKYEYCIVSLHYTVNRNLHLVHKKH